MSAGYRVVGLDCRGHGSSDKPHDPAAYSLATMATDVRRLFDELHRTGQTIVLVTHESDIAAHAHRQIHLRDGLIERDESMPPRRR